MKVLCFGSLNLDYVYTLDHIVAPGETISSICRDIFAGGKGLNQSIALAKAGLPVWHAGMLGDDGGLLLNMLKKNHVDVSLIRQTNGPTGHTIIQVDRNGQNSIVLFGGSNRQITSEFIDEVLSKFSEGDLILLQNEINRLNEIINKAYEKKMRIALNPSPFNKAVTACDLSKITVFLINEVEGAQITGHTDPEEILDWFASEYPKADVVLTLGGEGARLLSKGRKYIQPVMPTEVVDTTAAGDTFTGFYLEGFLTGRSAEESLRRAAKASSITVSRKGAAPSIPTKEEL